LGIHIDGFIAMAGHTIVVPTTVNVTEESK